MTPTIALRSLCLLMLLPTQLCLAEPTSLSGNVEAGSEDNHVSIRIMNKTSTPVEGIGVTVASQPEYIKDIVVTPSTIQAIGPSHTEAFDISFKVDAELKEDQDATITFQLSTTKGKLESNTATVQLRVKAIEVAAGQCWFRNESGFLHPADPNLPTPPPNECDFFGSCEEAALFAQEKGYGFEGECKQENQGDEPRLELVEIRGPDPSKFTNATSSFSPSQPGASLTYGNERGDGELSYGLNQYPKTILLGEPFSFSGDLRVQDRYQAGKCTRPGLFPGTSKTQKVSVSATVELTAGLSTLAKVGEKKREFVKCSKSQEAGVMTKYEHSGIQIGQVLKFTVQCEPTKTVKNSSGGVQVRYECRTTSHSGDNLDSFPTTEIFLHWSPVSSRPDPNRESIFKLYGLARYVDEKHILIGWPSKDKEVELVYKESESEPPLVAEPYDHPFEVLNSWGDGSSEESSPTAMADQEESTDADADSGRATDDNDVGGTGQPGGSEGSTSDPNAGQSGDGSESTTGEPDGIDPSNPSIAALIDEWLTSAEPTQNATEGADFSYNEWGQLEGTSADGGVAKPQSKPDAAQGRTSREHVWAEREKLDSVNHCTVGEFVERRLAGDIIDSCRGRHTPIMPNLVGLTAKDAKERLERLGLKPQLKTGPAAPKKDQEFKIQRQGIERDRPVDPGSKVTVWIYTKFDGTGDEGSSQTTGERHVCGNSDAPVSATWLFYSFYGGGGTTYKEKGGAICYRGYTFDTYSTGAFVRHTCDKGWKNCRPSEKTKPSTITKVVTKENNVRVYYYKKGKSSGVRTPTEHDTMPDPNAGTITLDDWRGKNIAKAKQALEAQGLKVKIVAGPAAPKTHQANTIQKQMPGPGLTVKHGASITLTIFTASQQGVVIPSVVGKTLDAARSLFRRSGLGVNLGQKEASGSSRVMTQSPPARMRAKAGSLVTLTVEAQAPKPPGPRQPSNNPVAQERQQVISPQPRSLTCNANIPGFVLERAPSYTTNGRVNKDKLTSNYSCWYKHRGKQILITANWHHTSPSSNDSPFSKKLYQQNCDASSERAKIKHFYGIGKTGKAAHVVFPTPMTREKQQLVDFHLRQVMPYAVPCSAGSGKRPQPNIQRKPQRPVTPKKPASTPSERNRGGFGGSFPGSGKGLDRITAGSCRQLPPPPARLRNPTCQCSEATGLYGLTPYTTCYWVDK